MFRIICLLFLCFYKLTQAQSIPYPDFKESNFLSGTDGRREKYEKIYASLNPKYLQLFEEMYKRNIAEANAESWNEKSRIPKIVHQIWLGGQVPEIYQVWMSSWLALHGWEYKLWTDETVKKLSLYNQDLFDAMKNLGEKSDILRLEILFQYGGVYVDVDLECLRPELFEELHQKFDFYIGIEPLLHGIIREYNLFKFCNAIIGSARHHTLLKDLIVNMKANHLAYCGRNIFERTGPAYITRIISQYELRGAHKQRNMYLPCSFFYPVAFCERKTYANCPEKVCDLFPEAMGIHYWTTSWHPGKKPYVPGSYYPVGQNYLEEEGYPEDQSYIETQNDSEGYYE